MTDWWQFEIRCKELALSVFNHLGKFISKAYVSLFEYLKVQLQYLSHTFAFPIFYSTWSPSFEKYVRYSAFKFSNAPKKVEYLFGIGADTKEFSGGSWQKMFGKGGSQLNENLGNSNIFRNCEKGSWKSDFNIIKSSPNSNSFLQISKSWFFVATFLGGFGV